MSLSKKSRSILDEINSFVPTKNKEEVIAARAHHIIGSAINLFEMLDKSYDENEAEVLKKRFLSSIRGGDPDRFKRMVTRLEKGGGDEDF